MYPSNSETHIVFAAVVEAVKVYSDQTGHFPVTSIKGLKHVSILYSYDANEVLLEPFNSITVKYVLHAYTAFHDYLKKRVLMPKIH